MIKRSINIKFLLAGFMFLILGTMNACKESNLSPLNVSLVNPSINFVGLSSTNQIIRFNTSNVKVPVGAPVAITGMQTGENMTAIDYRPATGQLYGLGSTSRLYVINPITGVARAIGAGPFTPALSGAVAGFDFNPTVDRIRVVTTGGQNFRLNPEDGMVAASDAAINGVAGAIISSVAYTDNKAGATTTTLYDVDIFTQKLYKQDANAGTLTEVGSLGLPPGAASATVAATTNSGFDISPDGTGLTVLTNGGNSTLFMVDLATGKATQLGIFPTFFTSSTAITAITGIIGIAINTDPVAYATDDTNNLLIFNPNKPVPVTKAITGLQTGENILGIDFRPLNGQLYALGSSSRLYTINTSSGLASQVGTLPLVPLLSGATFGFDFNPTVDAIRIVSNTGQNLRVSPTLGTVLGVDGALNPGTPNITSAAYTNNFAGATTTVLYVIDATEDKLYTQNPPNNGTLVSVGAASAKLGINTETASGFDIGGTSGIAYGLFTVGTSTKIYTVNLTFGSVTPVADFTKKVNGLAIGLGF